MQLITATVDVTGRLINSETGLLLRFAPAATVRLLLDPAQVSEVSARTMRVLRTGDLLYFDLLGLAGGPARATLRMLTDAYMRQEKSTSPMFLYMYPCQVESFTLADGSTPPDFTSFWADSVGVAYTRLSKRYQPHRTSHSTNNYDTIYTAAGVPLRRLWKPEATDFYLP